MPRRSSSLIPYTTLALALVLWVVLLMGVLPLLESTLSLPRDFFIQMGWLRSRVMELLIISWFFLFGSMVGSFINVVVWRMPRGVSVVADGSACPYCRVPIRLVDNIPVFGWIKLKGRCRVCRLPISPRYPIVEAIFGFVFLLVFFVELQTGGTNLPWDQPSEGTGILRAVLAVNWQLVGIYSYHMMLFAMLLTWTLMVFDRSRIPLKTIVFAWLLGLAIPCFFPAAHPLPSTNLPTPTDNETRWFFPQSMLTSSIGWVAGLLMGWGSQVILSRRVKSQESALGTALCLATVGLFMGWQFAILVMAGFGPILFLQQVFSKSRWMPYPGWVTIIGLGVLCFWKTLHVAGPASQTWPYWAVLVFVGFFFAWLSTTLETPLLEEETSTSNQQA